MSTDRNTKLRHRAATVLAGFLAASSFSSATAANVRVERVPEHGLQPKLLRSADGTLHLVYLSGVDRAADVNYARRAPGGSAWERTLRVNSQSGSAIAVGTIRGADLTLGRNGFVHVVWNGSDKASSKPKNSSPLLYARLASGAGGFEPERNVIEQTRHLDGGGTVAADGSGNVYVLWHASGADVPDGEESRTVFLAQSSDDGRTFAAERRVSPASLGACGCCGMKAFADAHGDLFALYRAAGAKENRDTVLLASRDQAKTFTQVPIETWKATQCPMSLPSISAARDGILLTWETGRHVGLARLPFGTEGAPVRLVPPGEGRRKHATAATNKDGETLLVWSEGTGWKRGGAVEWQLFDASGKPTGSIGHADGLPVWSLPATAAEPDGSFIVLY